jgi:uncharacterized protein DUF2846
MKLNTRIALTIVGLAPFLGGCASVSRQTTNVYPDPKPDKGLVYFYRENKLLGMAISYNVREGDQVIGALAHGTYFFIFADPGKHTYSATTEATSSRTIDVVAGKTYYIEAAVEMGVFAGHPALKIANEDEAKSVLPTCTYAIK